MADKKLQKLNRTELLEILLEQGKEIDYLKEQLAKTEQKLKDRQILIENAGSIAQAALQLNEIFEAAQNAADLYLENIKMRAERADQDQE
jgi:5-bromo-4-chloroindolyl phosphate hydrolysis protein